MSTPTCSSVELTADISTFRVDIYTPQGVVSDSLFYTLFVTFLHSFST